MHSVKKILTRISRNTWPVYCAVALVSLVIILFIVSLSSYRQTSFGLKSAIGPALRVFVYNQSKHPDPVAGCWYDSGDYVIFAQRNALSLYYLSLTYSIAQDSVVRDDLKKVIDQQYTCLSQMMDRGYKQFRDQSSHGTIVAPLLHRFMNSQTSYKFEESEGRDVSLLLYNIAVLTGRKYEADKWLAIAEKSPLRTKSTACCEEGPLVLDDTEFGALNDFSYHDISHGNMSWGISLRSILALQNKEYDQIRGTLKSVGKEWDDHAYQFDYIGGNYDIAGTIALERLYSNATGDQSFHTLSKLMYDYLHGNNSYNVDFTDYPAPHHPCGEWWSSCRLKNTLINGIDEKRKFDTNRDDIWRLTEIQLVGQARYILSYVLYNNL